MIMKSESLTQEIPTVFCIDCCVLKVHAYVYSMHRGTSLTQRNMTALACSGIMPQCTVHAGHIAEFNYVSHGFYQKFLFSFEH